MFTGERGSRGDHREERSSDGAPRRGSFDPIKCLEVNYTRPYMGLMVSATMSGAILI